MKITSENQIEKKIYNWKSVKDSLPDDNDNVWVCVWNKDDRWYFITKGWYGVTLKQWVEGDYICYAHVGDLEWSVDAIAIPKSSMRVTHWARALPDLCVYPEEVIKQKRAMLNMCE